MIPLFTTDLLKCHITTEGSNQTYLAVVGDGPVARGEVRHGELLVLVVIADEELVVHDPRATPAKVKLAISRGEDGLPLVGHTATLVPPRSEAGRGDQPLEKGQAHNHQGQHLSLVGEKRGVVLAERFFAEMQVRRCCFQFLKR